LDHVREILAVAPRWLAPDAVVVIELDPSQADVAAAIALDDGYVDVEAYPDLSGRPRALRARTRP
jgi:methylase of polypeptide subunit release factors